MPSRTWDWANDAALALALMPSQPRRFPPRPIAGALGGVAAGKASPNFDLGTIGNIISGLVGGGLLGQIVTLALLSVVVAAETGHLSALSHR